jgi:hypothetical protein
MILCCRPVRRVYIEYSVTLTKTPLQRLQHSRLASVCQAAALDRCGSRARSPCITRPATKCGAVMRIMSAPQSPTLMVRIARRSSFQLSAREMVVPNHTRDRCGDSQFAQWLARDLTRRWYELLHKRANGARLGSALLYLSQAAGRVAVAGLATSMRRAIHTFDPSSLSSP